MREKKQKNHFILYRTLSIFISILLILLSTLLVSLTVCKKRFYPLKYNNYVTEYSVKYQLDKYLVYSVIKTESGFNQRAISKKGAIGLMQLKPSTAQYLANKLNCQTFDLFNPRDNIWFGCYYLRYLLDKFSLYETALCAYNAGEGKVNEWLKNKNYSSDGKSLYYTPYKETREYLDKINKNYKAYVFLYQKTVDN